jgi:hypothetical protein
VKKTLDSGIDPLEFVGQILSLNLKKQCLDINFTTLLDSLSKTLLKYGIKVF